MTVTQTLGALGGWEVQLRDDAPDYLLDQLGFFGHVAIADGFVDVAAVGDGLLTGARYVGVLRAKDKATGRKLSGSGMVFWLGDEDGKGDILETQVSLTNATLSTAVNAILGPSTAVDVGTVYSVAGTYTGKHQFQSRREALSIICDAFNVEFRVNGNGTVDVGTAAQLYNTEAPDTIVVRKGAGTDMDLVALGGDYTVDESVYDYSTRVVLLGQTTGTGETPEEVFATGSADAPVVNYLNLFGSPVKQVRTISESGTTSGSVAARAQLQLNRFNRVARSLKVSATEFETEGNFVVGDNVYVYDPDTGIVNPANEVSFRGEVLHPDVVRVSGITWPVVQGMTVAFRTQAGVWLDLTPFVTWETGGNELTVGDLPTTLSKPGDNPVQARLDAAGGNAADASIPNAPTGLTLTTTSALNAQGQTVSVIHASWTAPALNTDSSVLTDLSHYVVQYRWTARAPQWQQANATDATELDLTVPPGLPHEVRVIAYDLAGHPSAPSATEPVTSAADSIAPNPPADPVVTSYLGQLRIEYAGTDSAGNPMPADTNRIDVHVGTTSTFTPTTATRVDSISPFAKGVSYATAPYSATDNRWVRLIAIDHTGNPSASSAAVGGHTVQVADGDVASISVGKLTAGIMTADVTISGRFATALTGARREMNAVGFQGWDASNNLTISLDGVNNLLTGAFRTALTGRRIELGTTGTAGKVTFVAPDGTTSRVGSYTATAEFGGVESLDLGILQAGSPSSWNAIQVVSDDRIYGSSRYVSFAFGGDAATGTKAFIVKHVPHRADGFYAAGSDRIFITETETAIYQRPTGNGTVFYEYAASTGTTAIVRMWLDGGGDNNFYHAAGNSTSIIQRASNGVLTSRFTVTPTSASFQFLGTNSYVDIERHESGAGALGSPQIQMLNNAFYGAAIYAVVEGGGVNGRLEVRDGNNDIFYPAWASGFVVSSSEVVKEEIEPLAPGALAIVEGMKPKTYRRKPSRSKKGELATGLNRVEVGLVAEEMPEPLRVGDGGEMVDLYGLVTTLVAAVQELSAEVKKGKK